jgi:GMP synthase (glutamine-hydrolysing)
MKHIAILDFGSQYTHLISRRIRELEVSALIYPADVKKAELKNNAFGIILSGGPQSVYDDKSPQIDVGIFDLGVPILGLCFGHQLMAQSLGGEVKAGKVKEYGRAHINVKDNASLLKSVEQNSQVWMSHGDSVAKLPQGFDVIGSTEDCKIAAMADIERHFYGLQFHPEVHHTESGTPILNNFVFDVCKAEKNWNIKNVAKEIVEKIKKQVSGKKVFMLVSGGVDSSVAFALLTRAIGKENVYGLYIDTGFMRENESDEIKQNLEQAGFSNLHVIDASDDFYNALDHITDPESKRKIIGNTFIDVKDKVAKKLGLDGDEWLLGQGTIYPDTIETGGTKHADTIKTHHNRVDAIQKLIDQGKVIEPIADFYKDEVREIGKLLGLPKHMIERHPFPGPGLAIRILCNDLGQKDVIPSATLPNLDVEHAILPIKSVGVQGDNRTYAYPLAIWGESDWDKLDKLSSNITNTSKEVNRVLLLLNKSESSPTFSLSKNNKELSVDRIKLLQNIDHIVHKIIIENDLYNEIWQFPVVLAPVGFEHFESIILRPVSSLEAMTAHFYHMQKNVLNSITKQIFETKKIDYIFYDVTNKPPGTIEWE